MRKTKILSCALAVMLSIGTLTVLPEQFNDKLGVAITADAASSDLIINTDSNGNKYVDGYKGSGGDVVIPKDIAYINSLAFEGVTSITSITARGDLYAWKGAFKGCTKLKKVVVAGDAYFEQEAFAYCVSLETFEIKGSIDEVIGGDAFAECTSLKSFKVAGNKYDYEIGEEAFWDCINLTSVDIKSKCTAIHNNAFTNCIRLESLTIPEKTKMNTSKGTTNVGFSYAAANEDDFFDQKKAYTFNNGSNPICLYYFTYSYPSSGRYWDTDYYGVYGRLENFVPRRFTLKVVKGSNAESYAKRYGVSYALYSTSAEDDKLAAPDNIRVSSKTKTSITLTWNKVKGADAYTVYKYNSKTNKYVKYKTVSGNSCTIKNLTKNKKYKFKVVALDKVNGKYKSGEMSDPVTVKTAAK